MGSLQLCTPVGSIIMHKFLIASCLAVAALAAPEADADAHLAVHTNALVGAGGVAPAWPSTLGYGLQSTCYGCRGYIGYGKRSADADPFYGYGHGIAHHGGHATSFVARSPQGLHGHYLGPLPIAKGAVHFGPLLLSSDAASHSAQLKDFQTEKCKRQRRACGRRAYSHLQLSHCAL